MKSIKDMNDRELISYRGELDVMRKLYKNADEELKSRMREREVEGAYFGKSVESEAFKSIEDIKYMLEDEVYVSQKTGKTLEYSDLRRKTTRAGSVRIKKEGK